MKLDAFYALVAPEVIGCPDPIINSRIVAAASEFCRETLVWTEVQEDIFLSNGVSDYDIDFPANAYALTVLGVWCSGRKLEPVNSDIAAVSATSAEPTHYNALNDFGVLRIYPIPAKPTSTMTAKVAYAPTPTAISLPDFLVRFAHVIADGAKAELMAIPLAQWSNPQLAAYYKQRFVDGFVKTRIDDAHGRVVGNVSVKPRPFA